MQFQLQRRFDPAQIFRQRLHFGTPDLIRKEKLGSGRKYDGEYKVNAVKLAEKIGAKKAADELGIPDNTLYGWVRAAKLGHLNVGTGYRTPEDNLNLAEENAQLRKQLKEQEKEIKRLNELNEFLEEASAFFAASRRRSGKPNE